MRVDNNVEAYLVAHDRAPRGCGHDDWTGHWNERVTVIWQRRIQKIRGRLSVIARLAWKVIAGNWGMIDGTNCGACIIGANLSACCCSNCAVTLLLWEIAALQALTYQSARPVGI